MKVKVVINLECYGHDDTVNCTNSIMDKIEKKYGKFYNEDKTKASGHISIYHKNNEHIIWIFTYDRANVFEQERKNVTVTTKSDKVIKYTGKKISVNEIKKLWV